MKLEIPEKYRIQILDVICACEDDMERVAFCWQFAVNYAKFWEDAHAHLEEKLRIEYGAELEAFKIVAEERICDEFEQKLNEATHADASEITSLRKELDKATLERDSWYGSFKELSRSHIEQASHIRELIKRKDVLEEWLQDYQKSLRETNVFHKNEATIHAITEILNDNV